MVFKAGMVYFSLIMQITMANMGLAFNDDAKIVEQLDLEFKAIQTVLDLSTEEEAKTLTPQILDLIIKEQKDINDSPHITKYEVTSSNVIIYFDESFFEDLKK